MTQDLRQTGSQCFIRYSLTLTPLPTKTLFLQFQTSLTSKCDCKSSIDHMLRVRGISQRMQGLTIDHIIPLFTITSLDHDQYPGVKSRYLAGDTALVNCDLPQFSGILSREETRQYALVIPNAPPSNNISNSVSNTPSNPPQNVRPAPQPTHNQHNNPL